jgi:hypothetical protein
VYIEDSRCLVANNVVANNLATNFGGGILSILSSNRFLNNTVYGNQAWNFGGGIVLASPVLDEAQNNIVAGNVNTTGDSRIAFHSTDSTHYLVQYNFLATATPDPRFVDRIQFRLAPGSPCINAGNPAPEFNDPDGTRNDQGAFGGPLAMSVSKGDRPGGRDALKFPTPFMLRQAQHERLGVRHSPTNHPIPFALSLSKGDHPGGQDALQFPTPFMLRQAQHERLGLRYSPTNHQSRSP